MVVIGSFQREIDCFFDPGANRGDFSGRGKPMEMASGAGNPKISV
jgi:hypothetical protein